MSTTVNSDSTVHLDDDVEPSPFGQREQREIGVAGESDAMIGSSSRMSVICDAAAPTPCGSVEANSTKGLSTRESKKKRKKDKESKKKKSKDGAEKKVPEARNYVAEEVEPFASTNQPNPQNQLAQIKLALNPHIQQSNNNSDMSSCLVQDQLVNQTSLSSPSTQIIPHESHALDCNSSSDMVTIKKGVLWQQQDHDKFHQRLFSRWKKRFFILTTDYLVCFKRSTSKVGRSEMGRFLYKISLGDILGIEWLRPKKSDKGAIILRMKNQFNLFLWSKDNLDEWMTLISSMRVKRKLRNGLVDDGDIRLSQAKVIEPSSQNGIYENAPLPASRNQLACDQKTSDDDEVHHNATAQSITGPMGERTTSGICSMDQTPSFGHFNRGLIEQENRNGNQQQMDETDANNVTISPDETGPAGDQVGASARPSANMINDGGDAPAELHKPLERTKQNLSSDDLLTSGAVKATEAPGGEKHSTDQSGHGVGALSKMSRSLSVRRERLADGETEDCETTKTTRSSNETICRDGNDNLVQMSFKLKSELSERREKIGNGKRREVVSSEPMDKHHMDTANGSGIGKHLPESQKFDAHLNKLEPTGEEDSAEQPVDGTEVQLRRQLRPTTNLIRRDESWHSLLALNQIGNSNNKQVERSLYAQQMVSTGESHRLGSNVETEHFQQQQHQRDSNLSRINIESTVTPLRGKPFVRQQSMQVHNVRRLPAIGQQQHSFDVGQMTSSQLSNNNNNNNNQQPLTSYHQKLLQLQLMHSRSHADYVRNSNGERAGNNDQQIYGPGSIANTSNHYGYYSMRSNFRSAASEFSFIRPSSSDFDAPHQPPPPVPVQTAFNASNGPRRVAQSYNSNGPPFAVVSPPYAPHDNGCNNLALMTVTAARVGQNPMQDPIKVAEQFDHQLAWNALAAPNRELPLKPNKKRQYPGNGSQKSSSSTSFGSSIVHFFRRAFSKRSKRQMAESCSSSLGGAYDDKFESIQRARSAFSTSDGQRSIRDELIEQQQQSAINQRHRMIDLIEAFANKTAIDTETYNNLSQVQNRTDLAANYLTSMRASIQNNISIPSKLAQYQQQPMKNSPLHKSNSISTSTGFSGFSEMMSSSERPMFVNGPMSTAMSSRHSGLMSSPLITRSTKVMSVHLTPVFSRKEAFDYNETGCLNSPGRSMNFYHQPRPSSIYGQPSLIASPMNVRDQRSSDFGPHRSSIHSYHLRPERTGQSNSNLDMRRHHHPAMKAPYLYLDTTREVAEEVSSPTGETKSFLNQDLQNNRQQKAAGDCNGAEITPKNRAIAQQRRSRIINPMLQSPTMSLIYDNHPMPLGGASGAYSHYDNHGPVEHQQSLSSMDLSTHSNSHQLEASNAPEAHGHRLNTFDSDISSPLAACRNSKMRQSYDASPLVTPSHRGMRLAQQQQLQHANSDGSQAMDMAREANGYIKPYSIISPLTPTGHGGREPSHVFHSPNSSISVDTALSGQFNPYSRAGARPESAAIAPMKSSQQQQQHAQYQQSPLVNRQTRVLKRGDGVQATLFEPDVPTSGNFHSEAVVNIVSAGPHLEPSLSQVVLRGMNNDHLESPASSLHPNSNRNSPGTRTFLVSPRLSTNNSKVHRNQAKHENNPNEREEIRNDGTSSRSTSSGTDPISTSSSSRSDTSAKRKSTTEARVRNVGKDKSKQTANAQANQGHQRNGSSGDVRRRGSSTDHSDELSSQTDSFNEPTAESRKWVTSKLMQ